MKKTFFLTCLAAILCLSWAPAQQEPDEAASVGLLPMHRHGTSVSPGTINPYGFPVQKKKETTSTQQQHTQEDQIREVISNLPVTGMIGNGKKVLLGDLELEEGEYVANVLRGQTERLLVKEITREKILIEWVEDYRREKPRTMEISIDMKARVEVLLKGQINNPQKQMGSAVLLAKDDDE